MRLVFFGTPHIAELVLQVLESKHEIVGVFTQPDAIRGRGKTPLPSPIKAYAEDAGYAIYTPESVRAPEVYEALKALNPDAICVVAYGKIIPSNILELPRYGCFNVHTSLLPEWRGAAPIERAILAGNDETGVSIMRMEEGLDTGSVFAQEKVELSTQTSEELTTELGLIGGRLLLDVLDACEKGTAVSTEQCNEEATYAEKIQKNELYIEASDDALTISRKVRASSSAHPSKICVANKPLTLLRVAVLEEQDMPQQAPTLAPGDAVFVSKRFFLGTTDKIIELLCVRPDGKGSMDACSFASGIQGAKGSVLNWGSYEQHDRR